MLMKHKEYNCVVVHYITQYLLQFMVFRARYEPAKKGFKVQCTTNGHLKFNLKWLQGIKNL